MASDSSSTFQRISIIIIAIIVGGGTIGFYFLSILTNNEQSQQQQQQAAVQKQIQDQQQKCSDTSTVATLPVPDIYKTTDKASTIQTLDIQEGTGAVVKSGDCLVVKYYGTLASDGTKFDENFTKTTAFAFSFGQGVVIKGWDQGLVGIKVGGTRRLVIPSDLAYGPTAQGTIPANSDLVFVVKLLQIK